MKVQPLARHSSLIVKEVDGETLVYDQEADKAHCLNPTAAAVWKSCNGETSVTEIARELGARHNATVDESVVWLALDQLEKFKLLEKPVDKPQVFLPGMSRRQAVRVLGAAAIALPIITSIIAPTPAMAVSGIAPGDCCDDKVDQCQAGYECSANALPSKCEKPGGTGRSCQAHGT